MVAGAISMAPSTIRAALAVKANRATRSIKDVAHVVIMMMENRSFDHYFGTMRGVRGFGDRWPIPLPSGKPVWYQSDGTREITPFHLDRKRANALKLDSTSHNFVDQQAAWNQGRYGNWPMFKVDEITGKATGHSMGHYTRAEIPFQFALAEAFTLCDNYHCSVIGGTDPNRIVYFSGSNFDPGRRDRGLPAVPATSEPENLRCWVSGTWPEPGYEYLGEGFDWPTIPDVLEKAGIPWRIYQDPNDNWNGAMNGCLAFNSFRNAKPGSPIYENGMSDWSLNDLAAHVRAGRLPAVSWVVPSQAQSEHACGSGPVSGAHFINRVLQALVANPDVWSKTVLFVTFDENDGFFDHVPNPAVPSYNPDGSLAGAATMDVRGMYFDAGGNEHVDLLFSKFRGKEAKARYIDPRDEHNGMIRPFGMGPRVPMYVVSPWSTGGWVASELFDHTSVAQFLEKRFGVVVPAISPWHRAVSGDLTSAFDFASPGDQERPKLPDTLLTWTIEPQQISLPPVSPPESPEKVVQEPGMRPSRPTPYALQVESAVAPDGRITLHFINGGAKGAVFHVYDHQHLDRIPRRYTVEAGKALEDTAWAASARGDYDLLVLCTNGFARTFKGSAAGSSSLAMTLAYDAPAAAIRATIRNNGAAPVDVAIAANAYCKDGPWTLRVAANGKADQSWTLTDSANWYDFTVSALGFERRFAGRVDNGRDLRSDPAMGT